MLQSQGSEGRGTQHLGSPGRVVPGNGGLSRKGARRALGALITARQEFYHSQIWEEARHTDKLRINKRQSTNLGRCL